MWISARTAKSVGYVALAAVVAVIAAPFLPRPHLPSLPEERAAARVSAQPIERARAQRMAPGSSAPKGGARWDATGYVGTGPAFVPHSEAVTRLLTLLKDARTVADPRAERAEPAFVVRLLQGGKRTDVMIDPSRDRLALAVDGKPAGTYNVAALHREYADLAASLFP